MKINQSNNQDGCTWLAKGKSREYSENEIYPDGMCPWLYYSAYPYMLGLLFGADFMHNSDGDANVACPAINGVRSFVRKREHPGHIEDSRISPKSHFVIYTEIVGVGECGDAGDCPKGHKVGDRFIFPTSMKEQYMCPAAWYQTFPFLTGKIDLPECLKMDAIKCPDWDRPDMVADIESYNLDD